MPAPKEPAPATPAAPPKRRRDRFAWDGDEVLSLDIDGSKIKSAPRK